METPNRILIIRPSALGDVCRTVPVLASLRAAYPAARIDWLVQDTFLDAVRSHPKLSAAVPFPKRDLSQAIRSGRLIPAGRWLTTLRDADYDLVFDFQGLARSGFFAWVTRAPRRVGFANAREAGWLGLTDRHTVSRDLHTVDRMLELCRLAGVPIVADMRLYPPPEDRAWFEQDPATVWLRERPFAVLAPTSRWPAKQWPADRFAQIADRLAGRGLSVAVVGAASERDQAGQVLGHDRIVDLVGSTTVGKLMAVIERSALVVGNDSAALHMAVGIGRPVVGLYGPTRVGLVGPYKREGDVIQHVTPSDPLNHKDPRSVALMHRITVDEVWAACEARLGRAP